MASKRCPSCGLVNPGSAQVCDCGLSFVTMMRSDGTALGEAPILSPKQSVNQVARFAAYTSGALFVAGFVTVIAGSRDKFVMEVGAGLAMVGLIGFSLARLLWRTSRGMD